MSNEFKTILTALSDLMDKSEKQHAAALACREAAVRFPYELRLFIEQEQRKKIDSAIILASVLTKLKAVTPNGADNRIDP